ncbi:MAG: hypothetical protein ACR2PT_08880 [Endozoicomonas sp.]
MAVAKAKVRPAKAEDFDTVYPLMQKLNNTRFSREIWQRLFTNLWHKEGWSPGYVLDTGDRIVGFLGGIYSETIMGGEPHRVCNLTAWIVEDDYRSNSIMLLMPFLRQKNTTLTSLTSSPEAYAVYKKLGFKDLDSSCRVIYPCPTFKSGLRIVSDEAEMLPLMSDAEQLTYEHHKGLAVRQLVVTDGLEHCYLLMTRRLGRGHFQLIGNVALFRKNISGFRRALCKDMDVDTLQVDERFLAGEKLMFSRQKTFAQPKQVRGELTGIEVSGAYSELAILATP